MKDQKTFHYQNKPTINLIGWWAYDMGENLKAGCCQIPGYKGLKGEQTLGREREKTLNSTRFDSLFH